MFSVPLIITAPHFLPGEVEVLAALCHRFDCRIHIRKPQCDETELRQFLKRLTSLVNGRQLTLHYHSALAAETGCGGFHSALPARPLIAQQLLSRPLHRLEELDDPAYSDADYVFLSPIFDSISKRGYQAAFSPDTLISCLKSRHPFDIVALGGISAGNIGEVRQWGFDGAALLGSLWSHYGGQSDIDRILRLYEQISNVWQQNQ